MIEYKTGNIFTEDVDALVNSVNCVGFMGRGIALQFKHAFPENFEAYADACKRNDVHPGRMFVYETGHVLPPRYIVNFPTKRHWSNKSRMEDIESGLDALAREIEERSICSVAVPPLGSGLGGLKWAAVRSRIWSALVGLGGVRVVVFDPSSRAMPNTRIDYCPGYRQESCGIVVVLTPEMITQVGMVGHMHGPGVYFCSNCKSEWLAFNRTRVHVAQDLSHARDKRPNIYFTECYIPQHLVPGRVRGYEWRLVDPHFKDPLTPVDCNECLNRMAHY